METDRSCSISLFSAALQAGRIARARGMSIAAVRTLIAQHTEVPLPGDRRRFPRVNVATLNVALDELDDPRIPNLGRRRRFSGASFD
jgi:K+-transporting ATPase ATPase C chain